MRQEKAAALKALLSDAVYAPLVDFLKLNLTDLRDINNVRELGDPIDQAVELKACKKAYQKIEEILNTIVAVKELPDEAKPEVNDMGIDPSDVEK